MERIIKFKAKRLDNAEWVEGYYVKKIAHKQTSKGDVVEDGEEHLIFGMTNTDVQPCWYEVDPFTVCQFTGLKDKDGKEVWEHDIVTNYIIYRGEVVYENGGFCIKQNDKIYRGYSLSELNWYLHKGKERVLKLKNLGPSSTERKVRNEH